MAITHDASPQASGNLRRTEDIAKEEVALAIGKISGAWKLTKLDNVEAKLKLQKFGWIERKLLLNAPAIELTIELTGDKTYSSSVLVPGVFSIPATSYEVGGAAVTASAMGRITNMWVSLSKGGELVQVTHIYLSEKARADQSAVCIVESSTKVDPTGMYLTITDTVYPTVKQGGDAASIKCTTHFQRPREIKQASASQSQSLPTRRSSSVGILRRSLRSSARHTFRTHLV